MLFNTFQYLIRIKWLEIKRSALFQSGIFGFVIDSIGIAYLIIVALLLGFYIDEIVTIVFPLADSQYLVSSYLPVAIILSALFRCLLLGKQKFKSTYLLHLPVRKSYLVLFNMAQDLLNRYSVTIILFVLTYAMQIFYSSSSLVKSVGFIFINIYFLIFAELFVIVFQKNQEKSKPIFLFLIVNMLISPLLLNLSPVITILLSMALSVINITFIARFLAESLSLDNSSPSSARRYCETMYLSPYVSIILKSTTRNKVYRRFLFFYMLSVVGGGAFFFLLNPGNIEIFKLFLILIICSGSLTANMIVTYLFAWDANWKDFIFSKPIDIYQYVKINTLFAEILALAPALFFGLLYIVSGHKILLYLSSFSLFNLITNIIQVSFSIRYYDNEVPHTLAVKSKQPARLLLFPLYLIPYGLIYYYNGTSIDTVHSHLIPPLVLWIAGLIPLFANTAIYTVLHNYFTSQKYRILNLQ